MTRAIGLRGACLALLVVAALAACRSLPREPVNPIVLERSWGIATAGTPTDAELLASTVERVRVVYSELPGFEERALRAHLTERSLYRNTTGITVEEANGAPWIQVCLKSSHLERSIAHELAHFYFCDFSRPFPQVVEEGLCELLAARVTDRSGDFDITLSMAAVSYLDDFELHIEGPGAKGALRWLLQDVPTIERALELDWQELFDVDHRARPALYGLGRLLAQNIGLEGLAALRDRAASQELGRVPLEWILEAAGLQPLDQKRLQQAFARLVGIEGEETPRITITLTDEGR